MEYREKKIEGSEDDEERRVVEKCEVCCLLEMRVEKYL
jgi:hypothetical protein